MSDLSKSKTLSIKDRKEKLLKKMIRKATKLEASLKNFLYPDKTVHFIYEDDIHDYAIGELRKVFEDLLIFSKQVKHEATEGSLKEDAFFFNYSERIAEIQYYYNILLLNVAKEENPLKLMQNLTLLMSMVRRYAY